jgi:hypothetical protein
MDQVNRSLLGFHPSPIVVRPVGDLSLNLCRRQQQSVLSSVPYLSECHSERLNNPIAKTRAF